MYAHTPSLNDIVERTRQMLVEKVGDEVLRRPVPVAAS
jgi:hypothetical protein